MTCWCSRACSMMPARRSRSVLGTGRTAAIVAGETVAGLYAGRLAASLTRAGFRAVTFTVSRR